MRRLIAEARVARLATAGIDGRPHVVPITFALEGESLGDLEVKGKGTIRIVAVQARAAKLPIETVNRADQHNSR